MKVILRSNNCVRYHILTNLVLSKIHVSLWSSNDTLDTVDESVFHLAQSLIFESRFIFCKMMVIIMRSHILDYEGSTLNRIVSKHTVYSASRKSDNILHGSSDPSSSSSEISQILIFVISHMKSKICGSAKTLSQSMTYLQLTMSTVSTFINLGRE